MKSPRFAIENVLLHSSEHFTYLNSGGQRCSDNRGSTVLVTWGQETYVRRNVRPGHGNIGLDIGNVELGYW